MKILSRVKRSKKSHVCTNFQRKREPRKVIKCGKLTCPLSSNWLLVSLSLSKDTTCFIQWVPLVGESGWTWILGGEFGSAFPATIQLELFVGEKEKRSIFQQPNITSSLEPLHTSATAPCMFLSRVILAATTTFSKNGQEMVIYEKDGKICLLIYWNEWREPEH